MILYFILVVSVSFSTLSFLSTFFIASQSIPYLRLFTIYLHLLFHILYTLTTIIKKNSISFFSTSFSPTSALSPPPLPLFFLPPIKKAELNCPELLVKKKKKELTPVELLYSINSQLFSTVKQYYSIDPWLFKESLLYQKRFRDINYSNVYLPCREASARRGLLEQLSWAVHFLYESFGGWASGE